MRLILLTLLGVLFIDSFAQDAEKLVDDATSNIATSNVELLMEVAEEDSKGRIKNKTFELLLGSNGDNKKTKITMKKPERALGVTIVISDATSSDGIIEIYTPANNKYRKMKSTPENMRLIGFDFFMADFDGKQTNNVKYELIETSGFEGETCYVIKALGNQDGDWAKLYISTISNKIIGINMYNVNNDLLSKTLLTNYQFVPGSDGKVYPMNILTENKQSKKLNTIKIKEIEYRRLINSDEFNLEQMTDTTSSEKSN